MLLLSFETRELISDKDFSCEILKLEVSSAGQVLLDHHDIHAKETIQLMGSGLISISLIIDFPNKI